MDIVIKTYLADEADNVDGLASVVKDVCSRRQEILLLDRFVRVIA